MFRYRVKYRNLNAPSESWTTVTLGEEYTKEEELIQALQQVIAKEERSPKQEVIILQISPER